MHLALVIGRTCSAFDQTLPMRYQFSEDKSPQVSNVLKRCNSCALTSFQGMLSRLGAESTNKALRQVTHAAIERDWLIIA
jgi:hypothetical protein